LILVNAFKNIVQLNKKHAKTIEDVLQLSIFAIKDAILLKTAGLIAYKKLKIKMPLTI